MRPPLKPALALFAGSVLAAAVSASDARRPNIVIFLADDLGYADVGVQGCADIPTPHLDRLARDGVRFTDGYATHPVCSPSRAGLMSGRYQHRFGFEHNSGPERFADPNFGLPRSEPTLAEKLKAAGYATGMVGKWHIGFKEGLRPHERGFDFHFGFLSGARTYLPGRADADPLLRNGKPVFDEKEYLTDAFAREAVDFIGRSAAQPWFLYVAFNAVHAPMEAPGNVAERFPGLSGTRRTYAGMLGALDDAVGRVMAKVRALGQEDNTLIFFYSDNGGPTEQTTSRNDPLRGFKGQLFEGGIRVPFFAQWKGTLPAGLVYREPVMGFDCHATALAAAGVNRPNDAKLDGVNLLPYLTGANSGRPHEQLFWRAGPQSAARVGDWKLVTVRGSGPMLFNLREDIGETNDRAASEPAKRRELEAAFATWAEGTEPARWIRQDGRSAGRAGAARSTEGGARPAGAAGARVEATFRAADRDGDGRLSRAEYPQPALFDTVDANRDGFATLEEVRTYVTSRRGKAAK
jgi:arylsulfatase A-like enzyme